MSNKLDTAYKGGPAFFSGETSKGNPEIDEHHVRIHCVSLESYEMDQRSDAAKQIQFESLTAQAERDPKVARLLLLLHEYLTGHKKKLMHYAQKK